MNITTTEGLIAIKFESDDRNVLERAANAVVIARANRVTKETDLDTKSEINEDIMTVAAITRRIRDNRAPAFFTPVEEGLAISLGEEGSTVFQEDEVRILKGVLLEFSDATVDVVPGYTRGDALDRAFSGFLAGVMATELSAHLPIEIV